MSLMARDSASEKAEGPLYVSEQGTSELPTPPKFASKFRLVSTPKQNVVRVQILSFSIFKCFLCTTYRRTTTMDLFFYFSARADPLLYWKENLFFLLMQKADKEYFAIFYYNILNIQCCI